MQVQHDREWMQGRWFAGTVRRLQEGFALVEYAHKQSTSAKGLLKEWFPVQGHVQGSLPDAGGTDVHTSLGFKLRPAPPAEVQSFQALVQPP